MKIKELQPEQLSLICRKHYHDKKCDEKCPLYRYRVNERGKKIELFCHGYAYTWYLAELEKTKNRDDLTEEQKTTIIATLIRDYMPTLEKEIEL